VGASEGGGHLSRMGGGVLVAEAGALTLGGVGGLTLDHISKKFGYLKLLEAYLKFLQGALK
jgi:hypothetical protein